MPAVLGPAILGTIGTAAGSYFQKKSQKHQQDVEKKAAEVQLATAVFERLSTAMDRRLYAMRRVNWGLKLDFIKKDEVDDRWKEYNEVLVEWNSNLSKNLTMNELYFGKKMKKKLESIQRSFRILHNQLVAYYYRNEVDDDFNQDADGVREQIHLMNVMMTRMIQDGSVGVFQPDVETGPTEAEKRNERNRSLQLSLNQILGIELDADGVYGRKTRAAVKQFQSKFGLEADGKAGPATRAKIEEVLERPGSAP